jgi:hypothetical protein
MSTEKDNDIGKLLKNVADLGLPLSTLCVVVLYLGGVAYWAGWLSRHDLLLWVVDVPLQRVLAPSQSLLLVAFYAALVFAALVTLGRCRMSLSERIYWYVAAPILFLAAIWGSSFIVDASLIGCMPTLMGIAIGAIARGSFLMVKTPVGKLLLATLGVLLLLIGSFAGGRSEANSIKLRDVTLETSSGKTWSRVVLVIQVPSGYYFREVGPDNVAERDVHFLPRSEVISVVFHSPHKGEEEKAKDKASSTAESVVQE